MTGWLTSIGRLFGRGTRRDDAVSAEDWNVADRDASGTESSSRDHLQQEFAADATEESSAASPPRPDVHASPADTDEPVKVARYTCTAETFIKARPALAASLGEGEKVAATRGMIVVGRFTNEEGGHLRLEQVQAGEDDLPDGAWFIYKPHWKEVPTSASIH